MRTGSLLLKILAALVCALANFPARAQTAPLDVVYVNGINNTLEAALANLVAMNSALVSTTTRTGADRRSFRVWLQYNPAGWAAPLETIPILPLTRDVRELFVQKVAEE